MVRLLCCDISALGREEYEALLALAGPERRTRAERCRRMEDGLRCLAAEALLRRALPGADLSRLAREPGGKPCLPGVCFNLSHSGPWVALALGQSTLGVDVETPRPGRKVEALTRRYFSLREQAFVLAPETGREDRFLQVWTGKESWLKYLGTGLDRPLGTVCTFADGLPPLHRWPLPGGGWICLCTREVPPEAPEWVAAAELL